MRHCAAGTTAARASVVSIGVVTLRSTLRSRSGTTARRQRPQAPRASCPSDRRASQSSVCGLALVDAVACSERFSMYWLHSSKSRGGDFKVKMTSVLDGRALIEMGGGLLDEQIIRVCAWMRRGVLQLYLYLGRSLGSPEHNIDAFTAQRCGAGRIRDRQRIRSDYIAATTASRP